MSRNLNIKFMLAEIIIASGANTFLWIVAVIIGAVAALGFIDNRSEKKA